MVPSPVCFFFICFLACIEMQLLMKTAKERSDSILLDNEIEHLKRGERVSTVQERMKKICHS